jgi:hypothetical protein
VIKKHTWAIIRPASDSLGFIINSTPHFLHFEPNKQYYFVVEHSNGTSPIITEKSEREFVLTATVSSVKGPEEYDLTKVNN